MTQAVAIGPGADADSAPPRPAVSRYPLAWALWWLLLPNLIVIGMWPIGGPSMGFSIVLCGLAAIAANFSRSALMKRLAVAAILAFNTLMYIAYSFNLDVLGLFRSVEFLAELDPLRSPEYLAGGALLALALGLGARYAPHCPRFSGAADALRALALVALLVCADWTMTRSTAGSYQRAAPAGLPVDSAMRQNGLTPQSLGSRNLVVIIVEALGVPDNAADKALFDKAWGVSRWSSRYEARSGTSLYFGSTTNAELREWCGAWSDYHQFDFAGARCLPAAFARAGFATTALHTFGGEMFDRRDWYPRIGFQHLRFAPELRHAGGHDCGGVFPGVCDTDVPRQIGDLLRKGHGQRQLVYWLTLNSHLPVPADPSLDTASCRLGTPQWRSDFPMLCRSYLIQQRLADAIHAEVMSPDFPDADVLIVGDHMPPFFQRAIRTRFDSSHVPWLYLKRRKEG